MNIVRQPCKRMTAGPLEGPVSAYATRKTPASILLSVPNDALAGSGRLVSIAPPAEKLAIFISRRRDTSTDSVFFIATLPLFVLFLGRRLRIEAPSHKPSIPTGHFGIIALEGTYAFHERSPRPHILRTSGWPSIKTRNLTGLPLSVDAITRCRSRA